MKTLSNIVGSLVLIVLFTACKKTISGSNVYVTEKRFLNKSFTGVESDGDFKVILVKDSANFVVLHGETNILPEVITQVSGTTLTLYYGNFNTHYNHGELSMYVHLTQCFMANLQGSGSIISSHDFTNPMLVINNGSGKVDLACNTTDVHTLLSGPGTINLRGNTVEATHVISGSGSVHAFEMQSKKVMVAISGTGICQLHATQQLHASISENCTVYYTGSPEVQSNISGSGQLIHQ